MLLRFREIDWVYLRHIFFRQPVKNSVYRNAKTKCAVSALCCEVESPWWIGPRRDVKSRNNPLDFAFRVFQKRTALQLN